MKAINYIYKTSRVVTIQRKLEIWNDNSKRNYIHNDEMNIKLKAIQVITHNNIRSQIFAKEWDKSSFPYVQQKRVLHSFHASICCFCSWLSTYECSCVRKWENMEKLQKHKNLTPTLWVFRYRKWTWKRSNEITA